MSDTPPFNAFQHAAARRLPTVHQREILRVAATLDGDSGEQATARARKEVLKWVQKRVGSPFGGIVMRAEVMIAIATAIISSGAKSDKISGVSLR